MVTTACSFSVEFHAEGCMKYFHDSASCFKEGTAAIHSEWYS